MGVEVRFHYRFQALRPSRARAQGWVNVVRAWPVPDLGNTKAAFSLSGCMCVCWGGVLDAASPTSIQWPIAPEPDRPWFLPVDTGHLGPSVDTQAVGWTAGSSQRKEQKSNWGRDLDKQNSTKAYIFLGTPRSG